MGDEAARRNLIDQIIEHVKNQDPDNDNPIDILNQIMVEIDNRIINNANPNELALLNVIKPHFIVIRNEMMAFINNVPQAEGGA